jgi:hypothetical protein
VKHEPAAAAVVPRLPAVVVVVHLVLLLLLLGGGAGRWSRTSGQLRPAALTAQAGATFIIIQKTEEVYLLFKNCDSKFF